MNSDIKTIKSKIDKINKIDRKINIMEVCGTHTMAISKFGLRNLLKDKVNMVSGPGCPVCVTPDLYLDYVYDLSLKPDIIIATYGDMIRVPGSEPHRTLENAKAKGARVQMVYSSMDAVTLAEENQDKNIVFLGIGFETTTPATATAVMEAKNLGLNNFYVLSMHKIVEPVMRLLLEDKTLKLDGFLCPGHVAVILGEDGFKFLEEYKCPGVITGFQMEEIVNGIYTLANCIENGDYKVKNEYKSLVRKQGNIAAKNIIDMVFEEKDDYWRGMGLIPKSGLRLKSDYRDFDIEQLYPIDFSIKRENKACSCGDVLKGKIKPDECRLFGKVCNPDNPVGPCMVSSEGSCAAYYKYNNVL